MRVALCLLVAVALGCRRDPPPASTPVQSTGSAAGNTGDAGGTSCGHTRCPADQYCIESTVMGGMAPMPGEEPDISTSHGCSATLPAPTNAGSCTPPEGRRVRCQYAAP